MSIKMTAEERYQYLLDKGEIDSGVQSYVTDLNNQLLEYSNIYDALQSDIEFYKKQKEELVGSLGMSLDDKRRKLYLYELKETLHKYKQELL